ncbi:PTS sugar transporter subunit IIB [Lactobacillus sp. CBA3605]|uniref:PTS sugar transporter subunit IIB n=1 Tax=Lactobacillus sp. CBA3605 TaxID=2099788 RepID=UPI000CFB7C7E|nr:PTS sugar transporter subunit IIB [Lactobacillus sp. CBA3605]AVK61618.1 PTS sugar transporter subunit IIB [Lactobacillus sp. CBA3605]
MPKKTIMLACTGGISTSLLVAKMQTAAEQQGTNYYIFATAAATIDRELTAAQRPDVLLLGPQISFLAPKVKLLAAQLHIPMAIINMRDYGTMNGQKVLALAETLLTS